MPRNDLVRLRHILDAAREAIATVVPVMILITTEC